jgi:hypothetical protein
MNARRKGLAYALIIFGLTAVIVPMTLFDPPTFTWGPPQEKAEQSPQATVDGETLRLPSEFKNVFTFCDHGNRVYVTAISHGSTIAVAPGDPSCATAAVDNGEGFGFHGR